MIDKMIRNMSESDFDSVCDLADRAISNAKNYQLLYETLYPLLEASRDLFSAPTRVKEVEALQRLRKAQLTFDQMLGETP